MTLQAGDNTVTITNPNPQGYAPGLDSITVGPVVNSAVSSGAITRSPARLGSGWRLTLTNSGAGAARKAEVNSFMVAPIGADAPSKATVLLPTPQVLGTIAAGGKRNLDVPIQFTPSCREDGSSFSLHAVFSAGNGADVGMLESSAETR